MAGLVLAAPLVSGAVHIDRHLAELRGASALAPVEGTGTPAVAEAAEGARREAADGRRARRARPRGAPVVPRSPHGRWEPPADRADPVELLEEQARTRVPELVPIRHGRMLVSPFTYYRGAALPMAADLASTPTSGLDGAALRRRAPVELRGLRLARAPPGLRRQRLRRDPARPVGVGRQAAGRQPRGGRPRQRLRDARSAAGSCGARSRAYRETMRELRRPCRCSRSGTPTSTSTTLLAALPRAARPEADAEPSGAPIAKARAARQPAGASRSSATVVDGEPRIVSDPPLIVPDRGAARPASTPDAALDGDAASSCAAYRRHAAARPAPPARAVPVRRTSPARSSASAASAPTPGSLLLLDRDDGDAAVPAGQGGRGLGARAVHRAEPRSTTTASASSPASG